MEAQHVHSLRPLFEGGVRPGAAAEPMRRRASAAERPARAERQADGDERRSGRPPSGCGGPTRYHDR
jgi:hypothetical protein